MLQILLGQFHEWSKTADRSHDGWPSEFPGWSDLIQVAKSLITSTVTDPSTVTALCEAFSLSEEDEELLDFARENVAICLPMLEELTHCERRECRWQAYAALSGGGDRAQRVLRSGLHDVDTYVRRRAIQSLAAHKPVDACELADALIQDNDPYLRLAAIDLVVVCRDSAFKARALTRLANDSEEFVRKAASRALGQP